VNLLEYIFMYNPLGVCIYSRVVSTIKNSATK
jgi:hypothetical protein